MLQKQNKAKSSKLTNKEKIKQNKQQQQKNTCELGSFSVSVHVSTKI